MQDSLIKISGRQFTDAVLATLQSGYPGLETEKKKEGQIELLLNKLNPKDKENIELDVYFYEQNPHLPLENLCSRMDNYQPKNESQQELLGYAQRLVQEATRVLKKEGQLLINGGITELKSELQQSVGSSGKMEDVILEWDGKWLGYCNFVYTKA